MKKVLALALVLIMCFALVACGDDGASVADYVKENGAKMEQGIEDQLAKQGMSCDAEVKADGNDIVISMNVAVFNNLTEAQREQVQATYDQQGSASFAGLLGSAKEDIPSLEKIIYRVCDGRGDLVAEVVID